MPKRVAAASRIEIRDSANDSWIDISHRVCGWGITAIVGELYNLDLVFNWNRDAIRIKNNGGYTTDDSGTNTYRVAKDDTITVDGVDLSNWVHGYQIDTKAGGVDQLTLNLMPDKDVLRINGTHPWEEPQHW